MLNLTSTLLFFYLAGNSKASHFLLAKVSFADYLCKQFRPRSGLFDTLMVFLIIFLLLKNSILIKKFSKQKKLFKIIQHAKRLIN